jgi:hypothetical protein
MNKHTAGPWKASQGFDVGVYGCGYRVALMTSGEVNRDMANARLIAAAPELLEALVLVRDYVVTMKQMGHEYQVAIDAAIAKATGETP